MFNIIKFIRNCFLNEKKYWQESDMFIYTWSHAWNRRQVGFVTQNCLTLSSSLLGFLSSIYNSNKKLFSFSTRMELSRLFQSSKIYQLKHYQHFRGGELSWQISGSLIQIFIFLLFLNLLYWLLPKMFQWSWNWKFSRLLLFDSFRKFKEWKISNKYQ